jgi:hypothetical protein
MAQRVNALVHVGMDADEAAEIIGCPVASVVSYGNGYAIVNCECEAEVIEDDDEEEEAAEVEMDPALDS